MTDKPNVKKALDDLKKFEDIVASCNRCGFCTSYCPTYNASGAETQSPRGRNQAFRALIEGRVSDPGDIKEIVDSCLLCGECTSVCFSEVPTAELMVRARDYLNRANGVPRGLAFLIQWVLPDPRRLRWVLKIGFWGKKWGAAWVFERLGILDRFAPALAAANRLVDRVPSKFLLDRKESKPFQEHSLLVKEHKTMVAGQKAALTQKGKNPPASGTDPKANMRSTRPKTALLAVCGSQYLRPSIGLATIKLLQKLKLDFVIPDLVCCGLPAASYGFMEQVRSMARENVKRLERANFDTILLDDSSCAAHFKEYHKIFKDDLFWLGRVQTVSQRIRDISSFLIQRGLKDQLRLATWKGGPVAYHDPCKAQYAQRITMPPRELLTSINGLTLVPVADPDQCCGGGGTYSFAQPEMSQRVLEAKVKNILSSGCRTVVTSSASCLVQLSFGLRQKDPAIEVLHLNEFLAKALGI